MSETYRQKIIEVLTNKDKLSTSEIQARTNINNYKLKDELELMHKESLLSMEEVGKNRKYWTLKKGAKK